MEALLLYGGLGVVSLIILYAIIQSATASKEKARLARLQVKLLIRMLERSGATKGEIDEIISTEKI